ncbi:hypothetical protein [Actinokineospora sp.]|uniref:hypothetical protein n=1 Tax=Actinokineospora sp. TaxID=1872133 RepID=UPI003D6BE634
MVNDVAADVEVDELSAEAAARAFDAITQREMGISGAEFLERWDAGEWEQTDFDEVPGLVDVWMSIPLVR